MSAAARGVIDFRRMRPLDPDWHRHCQVLLAAFGRRLDAESLDASQRLSLALVGNAGITAESFEKAQEHAKTCRDLQRELLRPWEGSADAAGKTAGEAREWRDLYVKLVGDPSSPEFKAREAEALRAVAREAEEDRGRAGREAELRRRLAARR